VMRQRTSSATLLQQSAKQTARELSFRERDQR